MRNLGLKSALILASLLLVAICTGCASRQAASMAGKTQREFVQFAAAANQKVKLAEDRVLELELADLQNKAMLTHASPDTVISHTQDLIAGRDARIAEWMRTNVMAANIMTELGAITDYNSTGVNAQDVIDLFNPLATSVINAYLARQAEKKAAEDAKTAKKNPLGMP